MSWILLSSADVECVHIHTICMCLCVKFPNSTGSVVSANQQQIVII